MYYIYILQSEIKHRYYIGQTEDLVNRLTIHNSGQVRATKGYRPWKIVYSENFTTRSKAIIRELEIKSFKGGIKFKKLLKLA